MAKKKHKNQKNASQVEIEKEDKTIPEEFSTEDVDQKEISTENVDQKEISTENVEKDDEDIESEDTESILIDTREINEFIEEELHEQKKVVHHSHVFLHFLLIILMGLSFTVFGFDLLDKNTSVLTIINSLLITSFTVLFVVVAITYRRQKKSMIFFSSLFLFAYFFLGLNAHLHLVNSPIETIPNFQGKSLTSVMKWAEKNKITVHQEYEYSDMIAEYDIISQDIPADKKMSDVKDITVSVSEGANPSKEIMLPNMVTWDDERVLTFIKENHLSNVTVDFEESDQAKDTVIEQSTSGSFKRNDELHLTFSYGEELGFSEVTLIDFTNKSKFEVEFYMKQHKLRYDIEEDFSSKIKKGYAMKQDVKAGETVKIDDKKIVVTISKGPKITVPELAKMSITDVTEWAIKNKLKLNFEEEYDDSVKENNIIKANYSKGDIIEQDTVVKVTLSRGALKMPKFESLSDFYAWANKYNIDYEEKHEFSDKVKAGEVIEYSHKAGESIKKSDTIIVTISDGEQRKVPDLEGLSKSEAISKLEKVNLKYNFISKNSSKKKNTVIDQSIKAGSEISSGTTITVTLSNGKEEDSTQERKTSNSSSSNNNSNKNNNSNSSSNNNNNNNNNNNSSNNSSNNDNNKESTPTCNSCSFRPSQITSTLQQYNTYEAAASGLRSYLQGQCPGLKVSISGVERDGYDPGDYIDGFKGGTTDSCSSISITLAK